MQLHDEARCRHPVTVRPGGRGPEPGRSAPGPGAGLNVAVAGSLVPYRLAGFI